MTRNLGFPAIAVAFWAALLPDVALAYIGPGAGLGAIALTAALFLGVLLLLVGLVWYPIKRALKRRKSASAETKSTE